MLDRLANEKLKTEADKLAEEGWKWIEAAIDFPYGHKQGLRRLAGETVGMTEEEQATRAALVEEFDRIEAEYHDADGTAGGGRPAPRRTRGDDRGPR